MAAASRVPQQRKRVLLKHCGHVRQHLSTLTYHAQAFQDFVDTSVNWSLVSLTHEPMALIDFAHEPTAFRSGHWSGGTHRRARAGCPRRVQRGGWKCTRFRCGSSPVDVRRAKAPVGSRTTLNETRTKPASGALLRCPQGHGGSKRLDGHGHNLGTAHSDWHGIRDAGQEPERVV
jgi:hypothetical protein